MLHFVKIFALQISIVSYKPLIWSLLPTLNVVKKKFPRLKIVFSTIGAVFFLVMVAFGLVIRKLYEKNLAYRDLEQGEHYAPPSYFVCDVYTCCKTFVIAKVSTRN
jgi:hypothetical protein